MASPARRLRRALPWQGLLGLLVLLAVWQGAIWIGDIPSNVLPGPFQVVAALFDGLAGRGGLLVHMGATAWGTLAGYGIGCLAGFLLALAVGESRWLHAFLYYPILTFQAVPKIAVAPLIFFWVGFGLSAKIVMVSFLCFFPVFINTLVGMRSLDPLLLDLYRANGASRLRTLFEVKIPAAAILIFSGLQIAIVFALVGCIVMEFVGSPRGLGYKTLEAANAFDMPLTYAAIASIGLLGVAGTALVQLARRRLVFWQAGRDAGGIGHA